MRVIFLDCDGVLNSQEGGFGVPEDDKIQRLKRVVDETEAVIVLSSSWRYAEGYRDSSGIRRLYDSLINHLANYGLSLYSSTPIKGTIRGEEIDEWIMNCGEDITSFVILDDDSDMEPHMDKLVKTDYRKGLQDEEVQKAIRILKGDELKYE